MILKLLGLVNAGAQMVERGAKQLEAASLEMNRKAREFEKRTRYQLAARTVIKTTDFADEIERDVMLRAAAAESERRRKLLEQLGSDKDLQELFAEALEEVRGLTDDATYMHSVSRNASIEAMALKIAMQRAEVKGMCEADPTFRAYYEESLRILTEEDASRNGDGK